MKTFKNFMVEGPSDLAPNPAIVKAIQNDKKEAQRREQKKAASMAKNLKNYQQGNVRAGWVKEQGVAEGDNLATFVGPNEDSTDAMDHRGAVTDSFYEDLARIKSLALSK